MSKSLSRNILIIIALLIAGVLLLAAYFLLRAPVDGPSIPEVTINQISESQTISVGEIVIISAQAFDPDGIERIELWVNGQLISSQANPDSGAEKSFASAQVWKPAGVGFFNMFVRAFDTDEFVGESATLTLEAVENQSANENGQTITAYITTDEESIQSLAEHFQASVEQIEALNPGLSQGSIPAGQIIYAPRTDQPGTDDDDPNIPNVKPAAVGQGAQGTSKQAQPAAAPGWAAILGSSGLGSVLENLKGICRQIPFICNPPSSGQLPPLPPSATSAVQIESCKVEVVWVDESDTEDGFQVFRLNPFNLGDEELVARLDGNDGRGDLLSYIDEVLIPGEYIYYVQAHNAAGGSSGPLSLATEIDCSQLLGDLFPVQIEMTAMSVDGNAELMHCYISVANGPFRRLPSDSGQIPIQNGNADIFSYLGGDNSIMILVNPSRPLDIIVDCVEQIRPQSQGGLLLGSPLIEDMGKFSNSHSPDEWDGRTLTGNSSLGRYAIDYRIMAQESRSLYSSIHRIEDSRIRPPEILRTFEWWFECTQRGSDYPDCLEHDATGLTWEWFPPDDADGTEDHIFRLYARGMDQDESTLIYTSDRMPVMYADRNTFGPIVDDREVCSKFPANGTDRSGRRSFHNLYYSVEVEYFTSYHVSVVSPLSQEFYINQWCDQGVAMEVTLLDLVVHDIDDGFTFFAGSPEGQVYGWLDITYRIHWNTHPMGKEYNLTVAPPPYTQTVTDWTYSWENMWLAVNSSAIPNGVGNWNPPGTYQQNNNTYYVPYFDNVNNIQISYYFKEHDDISSDDIFCIGFYPWITGSEQVWLATDEIISIRGKGFDGECTVTMRLRGLRIDEIR